MTKSSVLSTIDASVGRRPDRPLPLSDRDLTIGENLDILCTLRTGQITPRTARGGVAQQRVDAVRGRAAPLVEGLTRWFTRFIHGAERTTLPTPLPPAARQLEPPVISPGGPDLPAPARARIEPRTVRVAYLVTAVCLIGAYAIVAPVRVAAAVLLGAVTVAALGMGVALQRPRRWLSWAILGVAVATTSAMVTTFSVIGQLGPAAVTYPAPNELMHLVTAPVLATALVLLGRPPLRSRNLGMLLDVAGISLTNALLVWILLLRPATVQEGLTTTARVVTFANFIGTILVFIAASRIMVNWYRVGAMRWLGGGAFAFISGGAAYAGQLLHGKVVAGGAPDILFLTFIGCCGAAALSPSMAAPRADRRGASHIGAAGVVALTLSMLLVPAALLLEARLGPVSNAVAFAITFAGLGAIAVVRLGLSAVEHRRRVARADAVRLVSRELVLAATEDEVVAIAEVALRTMAGGDALVHARLTGWPAERSLNSVDEAPGGLLTIPLRDPEPSRAIQYAAPIPDLVELTEQLDAVTEHVASALDRIELITRIRIDEQERHFRSLVLTSPDVTLVSRDGVVGYATPSAAELFGRDVRGYRVDALVEGHGRARGDDDGFEGLVRRPDGSTVIVLVSERDLTEDPDVTGVVTTLRDVTTERARQMDLAFRASHDPLTRLANRETFHHRLQSTVSSGLELGSQAVLFVDLDDFKTINDTYGHHIGDRVLEEVARRIESCLRAGDVAARLGGDEFAVLLNEIPDERAAQAVAQRITDALSASAIIDDLTLSCQASVGLACGPAASMAQLREADMALYAAKAAGKGRWLQYHHGMSTPLPKPRPTAS